MLSFVAQALTSGTQLPARAVHLLRCALASTSRVPACSPSLQVTVAASYPSLIPALCSGHLVIRLPMVATEAAREIVLSVVVGRRFDFAASAAPSSLCLSSSCRERLRVLPAVVGMLCSVVYGCREVAAFCRVVACSDCARCIVSRRPAARRFRPSRQPSLRSTAEYAPFSPEPVAFRALLRSRLLRLSRRCVVGGAAACCTSLP